MRWPRWSLIFTLIGLNSEHEQVSSTDHNEWLLPMHAKDPNFHMTLIPSEAALGMNSAVTLPARQPVSGMDVNTILIAITIVRSA